MTRPALQSQDAAAGLLGVCSRQSVVVQHEVPVLTPPANTTAVSYRFPQHIACAPPALRGPSATHGATAAPRTLPASPFT